MWSPTVKELAADAGGREDADGSTKAENANDGAANVTRGLLGNENAAGNDAADFTEADEGGADEDKAAEWVVDKNGGAVANAGEGKGDENGR